MEPIGHIIWANGIKSEWHHSVLLPRLQSRTSNRKTWDHYPSSVGGKTLGIGLEVFVYEVFGNITQTLCVSFPKSGKISSHLCLLKFEPKEKEISGNS